MSKSFKKVLWGFYALIVFSAFFSSCDVGLGESVDVIAPTVSINYPPASVVIRDGFLLKGSWADDKGVFIVQVTVRNDDTGQSYGTYTAGLGLFDLSWSLSLNNKDENGNFPFPDGKYTVDVVATDTSGRISSTASRSFEIDNTAPIFVIKSPGTFSISNPSKYGSIFKVSGSIAEAHTVKEMLLTIYDTNGNKITSWTESNVNTAGGTSVTFASYDSINTSLSNNYKAVYNDETGGNQSFYCSVQLTDSAAVYNGSSSEGGNTTSSLWVNDSIYGSEATTVINGNSVSADLLSKNAAHQYEIGDFLSIYNGTYSGSGNASSALQILEATKKDTTENKLAFSLNKDANPTYSFLGYSFVSSAAANKAAKSGAITFKAECGLNETNFKPKAIKVYLIGPFRADDGSNPLTASYISNLYENVENFVSDSANAGVVHTLYNGEEVYASSECTSVSSWTESMALPDEIVSGGYYLLAAAGNDIDDVSFVSNNGSSYGFIGVTSGTAPNVIIDSAGGKTLETAVNTDYNTLEFLNVAGSVKSDESNISRVSYEVTVKDLGDGSTVGIINGDANCVQDLYANKEIDFTFDARNGNWTEDETYLANNGALDARDISTLNGKRLSYTVVVSGLDVTSATGKSNFTVQVDKLAPVVTINSITPLAEEKTVNSVTKKCVNGIITVVAKIAETSLDSVSVIASTNTGLDNEKNIKIDVSEPSSPITVKFDSRRLDDCSDLSVKVIAKDKAGNEGSLSNTEYYIDQSTDIPKIKLAGVTQTLTDASAITLGNNLFGMGNNTLYGTISDDDGLYDIKIYYSDTDKTFDDAVLKTHITSETLASKTIYSLNEDISTCGAGNHKLYIVVEDISTSLNSSGDVVDCHNTSGTENSSENPYGMVFAYDNDLPVISVSGIIKGTDSSAAADSYSLGMWLPKDFIVNGTAVDSSGIAKVVLKEQTSPLGSGAGTSTTNPYSWTEALTDQTDTATGGTSRIYVAYDIYGRSSECKVTYNIDSTAPIFNPEYITVKGISSSVEYTASLSNVLSAGTWFNSNAVTITGTVSNDTSQTNYGLVEANLDTISVSLNGNSSVATPTVSDGFSITLAFPEGDASDASKKATFSMTDTAGNAATPLTFGLKVDVTAPAVTAISASDEYITATESISGQTVSVTANDALSGIKEVAIYKGTTKLAATSSGTEGVYTLTIPETYLTLGTNRITAYVTDNAGNVNSEKYVDIILDQEAPTVAADWTDDNTSDVSTWLKSSTYTFKIPLSDTYDKTNNTAVTGTSGIASVKMTIVDRSGVSTEVEMNAGGKYDSTKYDDQYVWYKTTQTLSEGTNTVTIKATDGVGNVYTHTKTYTLKIDSQIPTLTVTSPASVANYSQSALTFGGKVYDLNFTALKVQYKRKYASYDSTNKKTVTTTAGSESDNYIVTENIVVSGATSAETDWSWTMPGDGDYTSIKFIAYDAAGNENVSDIYSTIVDTQQPLVVNESTSTAWTSNNSPSLRLLVGDWGSDGTAYSSGVKSITYTGIGSGGSIDSRGALTAKADDSDGKKIYYTYTADFPSLEDGSHSVTVLVTDEAGNSTTSANIATYNIDTVLPSVTASLNINGRTLYKRTASDTTTYYAVTYSADDNPNSISAVSGIKSLSVLNASGSSISISTSEDGSNSAESITLSSETGVTSVSDGTFYIPATAIAEGTNVFSVTVTDYAGNSGKCDLTIHYDTTAPVVSYSTPLSGATVYKKIDVTGTVTDAAKISASGYESGVDSLVKVEYISSSGTPDWSSATVLTEGTDYTSVTGPDSSGVWTLNELDTSLIDNSASGTAYNYYIRLVFQDTYGNKNADNGLLLAINQDADRPVISLTTISSMDEVISARTIYGNVTDSDGSLQNLWVIDSSKFDSSASFSDGVPVTTGDNAWKEIGNLSTSGSWSYNLGSTSSESDGSYSLYFAVKDKKGDIFYTNTGNSDADKLKRPKLAFSGVEVSNAIDNNTALTFTVDTVPPKITMYTANSELAADAVDSNNNTAWTAAGLLLGGSQNELYIKLEVIEDNLTDTTTVPGLTIAGQTVTPTLRTTVTGSGTSASPYIYLLNAITLDSATYSSLEGSKSVMATLSDDSGQEGQGATNIILDYTAPEVSIITPTATISDAVMAATTVKGTVADTYSSISKLEYVIPLTSESYTATSSNWTSVYTSGSSWEISFTSGSAESIDSLCYYGANYSNYKGAKEVSTGLGIYRIPFWFRVTDSVGNVGVISVDSSNEPLNYVYVDPEGGKPKAWINAPETGTVTSGTVTLYGGASDNVSVSKVCVQIDADGDGDIDENDYSVIAIDSSAYCTGTLVASSSSGANDWYILAEGTNSWKCPIVTGNIGAYSGTAYTAATSPYGIAIESGKKYLFARVRAIDGDGNTRTYTDCNAIVIDSTVPWFTDVKVCQYGSSYVDVNTDPDLSSVSAISEREYISGMYLSDVTSSTNGYWYLVATVQSNSDITSITSATLSSTSQTVIDLSKDGKTSYVSESTVVAHAVKNSATKYILTIPLETTSSGVIYAELTATNGVGNGNQTIKINIDSTSPSVYNTSGSEITTTTDSLRLKSQSKVVGVNGTDNSTTYSTIENSDGYFTFGDTINEAGSGLLYLAFWFKNTSASSVYDPMLSKSASSFVDSATNGSVYLNSEKLPALYLTGVTRASEYTFTSASVSGNAHVRVGGLVKIAGTYRRISAVSDGTVTFSPSVSTSFTTVEVIYAQVVDHMISETFGEEYDANDDVYVTLQNDDGDGMCETINQIGTSYQWTASVNSNNIPDGTTEIYVTAIDNAGNSSNGKIASIVTNNRPRLTKVFLGTDLNGNGTYDFDAEDYPVVSTSSSQRTRSGTSFGEFNYYTAYNTRSGLGQSAVKIDSTAFKVISGLCVLPEFTGGNGSLKYVVEKKDSSNYTLAAETSGTLNAMTARAALPIAKTGSLDMYGTVTSTNEDGNTNPIAYSGTDINGVTYYDFGGIVLTDGSDEISGSDGAVNYVKFTFWDETDGKQSTFGSQWATLVVPVTIKSSDSTSPEAKIKPFYWNSSTDNSVYINSAIAGHIELENDITSDISSASVSGTEMGSDDPKVSGKVKLEGIVSDDVRLADIKLSVFGGTSTVVGSYSSGTWTQASSLPTGVVSFSASDQEISQNGHTAKYSIVIDTEKFTVGLDNEIKITAVDWKTNPSTAGSTQTARSSSSITASADTGDSWTDYYKMDVVPYVTEIVTHLSPFYASAHSVYARTALGNYPVYEGETIQFVGYNLGSNEASVTVNGMSATTLTSGTVSGSDVNNTITLTENTSSDTGAKSGNVSLTVNSVPVLNNLNKNDALDSYIGSVSDSNYKNAYNRQPNGINNNTLTDDLALDVWQFKNAAEPVSGGASYVTMKINPKTGIPGFSYANSILYFNMPGYLTSSSNYNNGDWYYGADNKLSDSSYSQIPFGMNYGGFSHNTFAFDSYGYAYGAAMCTDTQSATASAFLQFFSRESAVKPESMDQNMNYCNQMNASRLDSSSVQVTSSDSGWTTDIDRIQSISMDTTYSGGSSTAPSSTTPVYVFMAYYDQPVKQVRFRWGTVGATSDNIDGQTNLNITSTTNAYTQPSSFANRITNAYGLDDVVGSKYTGYAQSAKNDGTKRPNNITDSYRQHSSHIPIQVVAASGVSGAMTEYASAINGGAGKYVSLSIANKDTANPVAIVTWYDSVNMALKMAYNTAPTTSSTWTVRTIDSTGGINVKTAVDSAGGIHFAYYDNINGSNLKYAYLDSYDSSSDPEIVTVDSFSAVGAKCTIDIAKDSSGNWVPYIGYQLSSYLGTPLGAKVAYRKDFTSLTDGASSDMYTGAWECSIVPTQNIPNDDQINVGVYRNSSGVAQAFTNNTYWSTGDTAPGQTISNSTLNVGNATILHGNNTSNPILGYGIDTGAIEMAQKK
ncbi:MAG: hypothetical protein K6F15_10735 [Treponema sp.]|nr:hypothetical protein [Treponema sp.]